MPISSHPRPRTASGVMFPLIASMVMALAWSAPPAKAAAPTAPRTIMWEELVPKDWNPFKGRERGASMVIEGSAREQAMMADMRELWDNAPTRTELNGQRIKLPGYVVPLDTLTEGMKEFLLVPYLGACIHSPPPPANQIVHVTLAKPTPLKMMDVVWVSGTLSAKRNDSPMGMSGYSLAGEAVEPYKDTRTQ